MDLHRSVTIHSVRIIISANSCREALNPDLLCTNIYGCQVSRDESEWRAAVDGRLVPEAIKSNVRRRDSPFIETWGIRSILNKKVVPLQASVPILNNDVVNR